MARIGRTFPTIIHTPIIKTLIKYEAPPPVVGYPYVQVVIV